jgi:hypothetical protein
VGRRDEDPVLGGNGHKIYRLQQAQKVLAANPQTTRVVGNSLGGAVALQLQKDDPKLASRTYGTPVWDPFGSDNRERGYGVFNRGKAGGVERHRSFGDPVSFFDGSAKSSMPGKEALSFSGPHAYQGLAAQHRSSRTWTGAYLSLSKGWTPGMCAQKRACADCMLRAPPAPASTKLPTSAWPAAWRAQVDKALGPAATDLQHEDARRMANTLSGMRRKDVPEIKAPQRKR